MNPFQHLAILGAGSWGTALAQVLAPNFQQVTLWTHCAKQAHELSQHRTNHRYLPDLTLDERIQATSQLNEAAVADLILFVVPTSAIREVASHLSQSSNLKSNAVLVACAKGIERGSGKRMSQILNELMPTHAVGVLSGPNHAEEVAKGLPAAAVIACDYPEFASSIQAVLHRPRFRIYSSHDVAGVELGGAMKNIFAIAAGISDGLGLGDNATAALVTRGLAEMTRLGIALGGQAETFMGLSGVGDLMVTCYSKHPRNNRVGRALGQGGKLEEIVSGLGMVAEGVPNTRSIYEQAKFRDVRAPLIEAVYAVLYENKAPAAALEELLMRDIRHEQE